MENIGKALFTDVRREFANQRRLAEKAIAQLNDEQLFETLGSEDNSVAVIMKHIGGNLRSRWTDFLTTDGEKPDRKRDEEFVAGNETRQSVTGVWERGWATVDATLAELGDEDLSATVRIRGEELPVIQAVNRSLAHTSHHVGQIVLLAKHLCGAAWQTLSIARGRSAEYTPPTH